MPDRFQTAEEALLKTLRLHPQLTMPQCHRVSGLEDRTESRRLVDQLVRDGILILVDEGGTKFYSRSPELGMDDPPPSPEPVPLSVSSPPTPEPPTATAPAKVESPAETRPTVATPAETSPTAIVSPPHIKTSKHTGVCWMEDGKRWRAYCTVSKPDANGKAKWHTKTIGSYHSEDEAARAREEFMHQHSRQSTSETANVPEAQEATAPAPAPADHTITICRLETFSPAEQMMQEMLVYRLRRDGLRSAREAGHSSVTVVYTDEAGDVVSRETVRFYPSW